MKQKLYLAAKKARKNSYSPYSNQKVGAALVTHHGKIFSGANVENASYGATICAERTAIFTAMVTAPGSIKEIVVITDASKPWPPCGMCLQVLSEFSTPDTKVHLANLDGIQSTKKLKDFLPQMFTKSFLMEKK